MNSIKLITDSTSDIPVQISQNLNIDVLSIPIAINGKEYFERLDFTAEEFYRILLTNKEVPVTSRINAATYHECFIHWAQKGYRDLICVTLNAQGSGTYESALTAKDLFERKNPELAEKTKIHIIDSRSYSFGYGYGVIHAAKMARAGKNPDEILDYLNDWLDSAEIYLACYRLDFAKKSGRIHSAAAFVGELLGLRPIIKMIDGGNQVLEKVRGDKNVVPALCRIAKGTLDAEHPEYVVMRGVDEAPADELSAAMTRALGVPPKGVYTLGPSVSINAGPHVVALVVRGKNRKK